MLRGYFCSPALHALVVQNITCILTFFLSHSYTPTGLLRLSGLPSSWPSACLLVCQRMGFFGLLSSRLSACLFAVVASRQPCGVRVSCWSSSSFHILYIALQSRAARTVVFMRCSSHARVVADISVRRAILFLCTGYFCLVFQEYLFRGVRAVAMKWHRPCTAASCVLASLASC